MPIARATPDAFDRARRVKLILFDVDGVLTDGTIWVVPTGGHASASDAEASGRESDGNSSKTDGGFGITSMTMAEAKGFSAHDGMGISLAKVAGLKVGFVTKRVSEAVKARAHDLKIDYLYTGQQHKMQAIREIMADSGFSLAEIAYAGDDIVDLPVLRQVGFAIAACNGRAEVLAAAQYCTACEGGKGAGRDAIDFILKAKGILEKTIEYYIDEQNAPPANDIGTGNM